MVKYTNDHIMNQLMEIHTSQEVVKSQVKDLTKTIKGNGQPGIMQEVSLMKTKINRAEGAVSFLKVTISILGVANIFQIIRIFL